MKNGMPRKILSLTLVILMILTAVMATGCAKKDKDKGDNGKDFDEIKKKAEDAGYEVKIEDFESAEGGKASSMEIVDPKGDGKITYSYTAAVYEYVDQDSADKAYKILKDQVDMLKSTYKDAGIDFDYEIKKSGKIIIVGVPDMINKLW